MSRSSRILHPEALRDEEGQPGVVGLVGLVEERDWERHSAALLFDQLAAMQ